MRTRQLIVFILLIVTIAALVIGIITCDRSDSGVVLVFKGYSSGLTNPTQVANLELRNLSGRAIWLCFEGREFPSKAPFLERPIAPAPVTPVTNDFNWTNIVASFGHYFMHGENVSPGQSLLLEFPLIPGKSASKVGIDYYVGTFEDGNDFVGRMGTPLLSGNGNLKDRAVFYWERFKSTLRAAKRYEVWCAEPVFFHTNRTNALTVELEQRERIRDGGRSPKSDGTLITTLASCFAVGTK